MQILLIILVVFLLVIISLLVAPISILVDTLHHNYRVVYGPFGEVKVDAINGEYFAECKIFFWKKRLKLNLSKLMKIRKEKEKDKEPNKGRFMRGAKFRWRRVVKILKSFTLVSFYLNFDTDDYYYNSLLYPLCFMARMKTVDVNVNYEGVNEVFIQIKNRPINIIYNYITN